MTDVTMTVEMYLSAAWADVTADVRAASGLYIRRGLPGTGPLDLVASSGSLTLTMDNSTGNSAGLLGYYAPDHANLRTGFGISTRVRVKFTDGTNTRYKFHGRITAIEPEFGQYAGRSVLVQVADYMEQLATHKLNLLPVQTSKRADQLITTVISNMTLAPVATDYDTGVDTFRYALDSERDERTTGLAACQKICQSGSSYLYIRGDATMGETLTFEDRSTRLTTITSAATFSDSMSGLEVSRDVQQVLNVFKARAYPRRIDAAATTVLATIQREISLAPGEVFTTTMSYRDPSGASTRVSGLEMVTPVADTDYKMSSISGDDGNDLNASLGVSVTFGGNSAEAQLTNNAAVTGYVNLFQLRGKGVYLYDPVDAVYEDSSSVSTHGERVMLLDLPYQDNPNTAQDVANGRGGQYANPSTHARRVTIVANKNSTLAAQAILRDIGDRITIAETATGVNKDFFIDAVEYEYKDKVLRASWLCEPAGNVTFWILGDSTYGVLGTTTRLGW